MKAQEKIEKVGVVGLGYVGLPLALAAWQAGFDVYGVDVSLEKVQLINSSSSPVDDVRDEEIRLALESGRFTLSTNYSLLANCDVVVLCVPTPLDANNAPDLNSLKSACRELASVMKEGSLLINESTSFPGTLRNVISPLVRELRGSESLLLAVAPERVDPGNQKWNFRNTPRVIGGLGEAALNRTYEFYIRFCEKIIRVSSPEVAELSKLTENTYRLVNIALVNQIANFTHKLGINMYEVLDAAESKPYGFSRFNPGLGVGGHCIPIDPMYLAWYAEVNGDNLEIIKLSQRINEERTKFIAEVILGQHQDNDEILIWGLSYKSGIADLRESPSIFLIEELRKRPVQVKWYDKKISEWNGETRSTDSTHKILVIVHDTGDELLTKAIGKSRTIFDLTGHYRENPNVISI